MEVHAGAKGGGAIDVLALSHVIGTKDVRLLPSSPVTN